MRSVSPLHLHLAFLMVFLVCCSRSGDAKQETSERSWQSRADDCVLERGIQDRLKLFRPMMVRLGPDGSVYLLDFFDGGIKRIDAEGKVDAVIGDRVRYGMPSDFRVGEDGRIWAAMGQEQQLAVFEPDGRLAATAELEHFGLRFVLQSPRDALVWLLADQPGIFARVAPSASEDRVKIDRQPGPTTDEALLWDGFIEDLGPSIAFATSRSGRLLCYSKEGQPQSEIALLGAPPAAGGDGDGGKRAFRIADLGSSAGYAAVSAYRDPSAKKRRPVVDLYDCTGYHGSIEVPDDSQKAVLMGEHLFAFYSSHVDVLRCPNVGPSQGENQ